MNTCAICETRRPRRYCPGVRGDICSLCCGTERENTVSCPFECEYLQAARAHEQPPMLSESDFPNRDIRVSEEFLVQHEPLLILTAAMLSRGANEAEGVIDYDVREALEALIKTYRTKQSGLIYESVPSNPVAAHLYHYVERHMNEARENIAKETGLHSIRDTDVLGIYAFLQRLEIQHNNGRRRGRAFLDFLSKYFPTAQKSSLVV